MGNLWHIKNWFKVGHEISWKLSFNTLISFLVLTNTVSSSSAAKTIANKHKIVLEYLEAEQSDIIEKYRNIKETPSKQTTVRYIWSLWWQGEETAPELVKACLARLRRNANGAKLIVITKNNYKEYVEIPEYILEKREKGYISFAQLSDILRFTLLEKYGGLWLDSTIYTSKPIPKEYFSYPFFSQHTKWSESCFVQHNLWHGFSIGSQPGGKLVSFAKEMFYDYWIDHDVLVDYFMIDYILMIAYNQFPDIKDEIDSLPYSSERLYDLVTVLSSEYDKDYFENLMDECIFSKLNWHASYKTTANGKDTYYSHIINNSHF